jgi:hypothetical protein
MLMHLQVSKGLLLAFVLCRWLDCIWLLPSLQLDRVFGEEICVLKLALG